MNILFILPQFERGGGQVIQALELAKFMKTRGHNIYIISDRSKIISKDSLRYLKTLNFTFIGKKSYDFIIIIKIIKILFKSIRLIKSKRIEIIQAFDPHFGGMIGSILNLIFSIPTIIRFGAKYIEYYIYKFRKKSFIFRNFFIIDILSIFLTSIEKFSILIAEKIIANCKFIENYYINKMSQKNRKKLLTIPSGIDLRTPALDKTEENHDKIAPFILYIGRIVRYKGIETLIDVFIDILRENQSLKLILIGSTKYDKKYFIELQTEIRENYLMDKIIFKGSITHSKLFNFLRNAEFLVLPSEKDKYKIEEGLPNVILEAFKVKCPVIASNTGGIKEVVKNYYNGLLFQPKNEKDLYEKMKILLNNLELKRKIIKNAFRYLKNKRDIEFISKKYIHIYKELKK
ncbi:MAG: glycosyltransferase [Candidatus Lokiarchaeota archaeon]|nr:glycosyltransferase [Candidatus Lokiarchaeota archaeon]